MRKLIVATFMTMDGVLQAPGAPEEDPSNGFAWGGWQAPHGDDMLEKTLSDVMSQPFDLLLGHRTYEIFIAHWPYQNDEIGTLFNRINKYVVATTPVDLSWQHSHVIRGNVVEELKKLKWQDGPNLLVHGSSRLVQTLLQNRLIDELHTWTYPITLGKGKKLFQEGTPAQEWKMINGQVSPAGVIYASYVPAGEVRVGSFSDTEPSAAELARRERWKKTDE